jgi:sulfur carrier protein ThiS
MAFFFDNATEPVTALFDEEGTQLFETVVILEMSAAPSNTFAEHTLEDGTVVSDNKIKNQTRIGVTAIFNPDDFKEAYAKLKEADNNNVKFTVQNRVDTYTSMYIESYPYSESAKIANTIAVNINFVEQKFTGVKVDTLPESKVNNEADADTADTGTKLPQASSTTLLDLLKSGGIL